MTADRLIGDWGEKQKTRLRENILEEENSFVLKGAFRKKKNCGRRPV